MDTIDINRIDSENKTYCISFPLDDDALLSAIDRYGILTPLALIDDDRPVIVCGHKRLRAAQILGISKIPFYRIGDHGKKAVLTAVIENAARALNTVEKALCVERMAAFEFSRAEIESIEKLMGLPVRAKTTEAAVALSREDDFFKTFVIDHKLPLPTVEYLLWFAPEDRTRILNLLDPLHPSTGFLREVVHLLMLLKVKSGSVDYDDLADAGDVDALRKKIKLLTHPTLTDLEHKLEEIVTAASLPPQIRLTVDPSFEREWIEITLKAKNASDIEEGLKKLEQIQSQGHLQRILDLTHGTSD
jgi:hypothetical protein